jgi:hypothetical protein
VVKPHKPVVPGASPDDDPTGVRALLSALPEPDPMPQYLVERINASLAAEQAQRADRAPGAVVTPLHATSRRRPRRLLFAIAGAAAAVALVAVVGNTMFTSSQPAAISSSAAIASTSSDDSANSRAAKPAGPQSADDKAVLGRAKTLPLVQMRLSHTRYTQAGFVTQTRILHGVILAPVLPKALESSGLGPTGTARGLTDCLSVIGAAEAQVVQVDVALYEGQPAVIIVATTNGLPVAYAVGRQCSRDGAAVLHAATPLP